MLKFFKMNIPNGDTRELVGIQTWMVTWESSYGDRVVFNRTQYQAFATEKDAIRFKLALESAHKLLRNDGGFTKVKIEKLQSGL